MTVTAVLAAVHVYSVVIVYQAVMKKIPESVVDEIQRYLSPQIHETF